MTILELLEQQAAFTPNPLPAANEHYDVPARNDGLSLLVQLAQAIDRNDQSAAEAAMNGLHGSTE